MTINVVTSCSLEGWHNYGRNFVKTFDELWPDGINLYVVSEDDLLSELVQNGKRQIHFRPLKHYSPRGARFLATMDSVKWAKGDAMASRPKNVSGPTWRPNKDRHCFRHDAYKFSKKVFAIEIAASEVEHGRLFWIDADVVTFAPVPIELAEQMLPAKYALSCLARKGYHSECGFVGYNLEHPDTRPFIRAFAETYISHEVFNLPEWHDSYVFDWLRRKRVTPTYEIPHRSKAHPFINSELGRFLDHFKGSRKKHGRSHAADQITHSKLPYWAAARR